MPLVAGAACQKKNGTARDDYEGVVRALDVAEPPAAAAAAPAAADVPGVDTSKLSAAEKARFAKLLDRLQSPCGKAHSLRKSLTDDPSCKRARFAARYVAMLVHETDDDLTVRDYYDARYRTDKRYTFDTSSAPHLGQPGAPIAIVEFLDYG
ncbi:MAG: hypothetical protein D6689_14030 [Deltaproteobacteria bacterium]|nr:MAG: hypothetical protein D6689_14030 [Deltaproteobacteria bacterium]